jgi:ATP-dependent RNA helicase RhlB
MDFSELNLHPDLRRGVEEVGFVTCMPVQAAVYPHAFAGEDIYAQSQTGTGKTAAFLVSIFQRIMTVSDQRSRKVLILAPTRELAVQIEEETHRLGKYLPVSAGAFYGGMPYGPQIEMLRKDVQVIIGTPGRIIDLLHQGMMVLKEVGFLVVDEADRMFDMGFIDDLRRLLRYLPPPDRRQTFLFSATLGLKVKELAWDYMREPKEILIEPEHVTVQLVTQELYHVAAHEKFRVLLGLLRRDNPRSALIFCNQKAMVEELARRLQVNGVECEYIIGDLPQSKRLRIIERLKSGELEILVATDVAARGLDVEALDLVVNYDLPEDPESYVHRIGRTARAGKAGKAVALACERFVYGLPAIEDFIGMRIPVLPYGAELLPEDKSRDMRFRYDRGHGEARRGPRDGSRGAGRGAREGRGGRVGHDGRAAREGLGPRGDRVSPQAREGGSERRDARAPAKGRDPYSLSQEERMAAYREKYGGDMNAGAGRGGPRKDRAEGAKQGRRSAGEPRAGAVPRPP